MSWLSLVLFSAGSMISKASVHPISQNLVIVI